MVGAAVIQPSWCSVLKWRDSSWSILTWIVAPNFIHE